MPREDAGAFSQSTYETSVAYILQVNGIGVPAVNGPDLPVEEWSRIRIWWP